MQDRIARSLRTQKAKQLWVKKLNEQLCTSILFLAPNVLESSRDFGAWIQDFITELSLVTARMITKYYVFCSTPFPCKIDVIIEWDFICCVKCRGRFVVCLHFWEAVCSVQGRESFPAKTYEFRGISPLLAPDVATVTSRCESRDDATFSHSRAERVHTCAHMFTSVRALRLWTLRRRLELVQGRNARRVQCELGFAVKHSVLW